MEAPEYEIPEHEINNLGPIMRQICLDHGIPLEGELERVEVGDEDGVERVLARDPAEVTPCRITAEKARQSEFYFKELVEETGYTPTEGETDNLRRAIL